MKIELEVSEEGESTDSPWWAVIDPYCQQFSKDPGIVASMVTGPFFSRQDAEEYLQRRRYDYSRHAVVYCLSGYWSDQYKTAIRNAEQARTPVTSGQGKAEDVCVHGVDRYRAVCHRCP